MTLLLGFLSAFQVLCVTQLLGNMLTSKKTRVFQATIFFLLFVQTINSIFYSNGINPLYYNNEKMLQGNDNINVSALY